MLSFKRKYTVAPLCPSADSTFKRIRAQTPNSVNLGTNSPRVYNQDFVEPNPPQQQSINFQNGSMVRSPSVQNFCHNGNGSGSLLDRMNRAASVTPQPIEINPRMNARRSPISPFVSQNGNYGIQNCLTSLNDDPIRTLPEQQNIQLCQDIEGQQYDYRQKEDRTGHVGNSVRESTRSESMEPRIFESRETILKVKREALQSQMNQLTKDIEDKYSKWVGLRKKLLEYKTRRLAFEDYVDIANQGQNQIRHHLNNVYNPGQQLAEKANEIVTDVRKSHQTKLEKIKFEKSKLFSLIFSAMDKKEQELIHQKEFNLRTLEHYKVQEEERRNQEVRMEKERMAEKSLAEEKAAYEKAIQEKVARQKLAEEKSLGVEDLADMDVQSEQIIGDEHHTPDCSIGDDDSQRDKSLATSDTIPMNDGISPNDEEKTDLTATSDIDEECIILSGEDNDKPARPRRKIRTRQDSEATDLDESDEEKSFTPCQAQRPK